MTKLHIVALLSVIASCGAVPALATSLAGCSGAPIATVVPTVATIESDATAVLAFIQTAVNDYFAMSPDAPVQAEIEVAIEVAESALVIGAQSLYGVVNASEGQMVAAFADFENAYAKLIGLLAKVGLVPSTPSIVADSGGVGSGAADGGTVDAWAAHTGKAAKALKVFAVLPTPRIITIANRVKGGR